MVQILNNYSETLNGAVTDVATTFTVSNAPTGLTVTADNPLTLTLDDESNIEVVRVTAISGNDLTVVRGYEGTAQAWSDGALIECRLTNLTLTEMSSDSGITESMAMTSDGAASSTLSATGIKHLAEIGDTVTGSGGESSVVVSTPTDDSITVNGVWADGTLTRPRVDNDHIQRQGGLNVWRS